jgi:hypothetical protein
VASVLREIARTWTVTPVSDYPKSCSNVALLVLFKRSATDVLARRGGSPPSRKL